ncbi:hypothetical protein BV22DRAFT_1124381 [Leucogyrophana mollusca]|uniref:Uncharacterized protein n=1 Tax=Leucogyrophana mollusca TaxID=85980 RepID=A0ACB8C054_9AGAM|nr:hypothetical protein BV22DRAFT_1124381 [Leucogyrophana mollusca]
MFSKPAALLTFVAAATLASASTCTNTKGLRSDQWELKVSSATNCRYIEGEPAPYAGSLDKGCYGCYELSSHVRGKLRSFAFTAGNAYDLRLYKDSRCKELITHSHGKWLKPDTHSKGTKYPESETVSFNVCKS